MSTDKTQHGWWSETFESVKETITRNGGLFTAFAVVFIIFTGITLVNNPGNWWTVALAVGALFFTIFLFMNARVVIKSIVTIVMTTVLASFGFSIGAMADPYSTGALTWPLASMFLLFVSLAASYAIPSGRSRWGSMMVSQIVFFIVAVVFSLGIGDAILAVFIATIFGMISFGLLHFLTGASRARREHMPLNTIDDGIRERLIEGVEKAGWDYVDLSDPETDRGGFLVWDEHAYLLYPVDMTQPFSMVGKRKPKFGYKGRSINPWLLNVAFKETPTWRSRGADIMTVLVDMRAQNGGDVKAVGAVLPDTKKQLPIGIVPGRALRDNAAKPERILQSMDVEFFNHVRPLTDKQRDALGKMKPEEDFITPED